MANTIKIKNSGTASNVPSANSLSYGELAINYADGLLFYKNPSNTVISSELITGISGTTNQITATKSSGGYTLSFPSSIVISSDITANGTIISNYSIGDEGGEIRLAKPQTNTSLASNITIDIYQNQLRIFETGGTNRGAYIDFTAASTGVGSNLLSGGGGATNLDSLTDVTITSAASGDFLKYNGSAWINDPIDLGTDTTGNYMSGISGTSPVSVSHTPGEGSSATVSLASGYGDTQNPYASKTANYVLAAPNGVAGVPTFRAIVASDIPTLNQNTTGSAAILTTTRTIWGQNFDGSANVTGSLSNVTTIALNGSTSGTTTLQASAIAGTTTITFPSTTGTVVTTGDTGTVTSTMIANGTIIDADISSAASIGVSKLASGTAGQVLMANATGVATYTSLSGDVTINSSGVTTIAANSVALGTDTTGNYMTDVSAGTGISITHTPAEGSTATIAVNTSYAGFVPTGSVFQYAGSTAPTGYLICDGAAVSRTTYAALFAIVGTRYGTGDGSTTFNLPSMATKVPQGITTGLPSGTTLATGAQSADHTHTITTGGQSADHTHNGTSGNASANHSHNSTWTVGTGNDNNNHTHGYQKSNGSNSGAASDGVSTGHTHTWNANLTTGGDGASHTHNTTTGGVSVGHTHSGTTAGVSVGHTHSLDIVQFIYIIKI